MNLHVCWLSRHKLDLKERPILLHTLVYLTKQHLCYFEYIHQTQGSPIGLSVKMAPTPDLGLGSYKR